MRYQKHFLSSKAPHELNRIYSHFWAVSCRCWTRSVHLSGSSRATLLIPFTLSSMYVSAFLLSKMSFQGSMNVIAREARAMSADSRHNTNVSHTDGDTLLPWPAPNNLQDTVFHFHKILHIGQNSCMHPYCALGIPSQRTAITPNANDASLSKTASPTTRIHARL